MTQQKTLNLFITLASRIYGAGYEVLQELHEFSRVGAMPKPLSLIIQLMNTSINSSNEAR
jgi:hypothetical protein